MTQLRRMMLEELQRRNYSEITTRKYLQVVTNFAQHFGKSPDKLGPDQLRTYQAYLLRERKLAVARRWLAAKLPELRMNREMVCSGDEAVMTQFDELAGAAQTF